MPEPTEFDYDAYYRDTRRLSIDARGAWMDCLCQMRIESPRGRLSEPMSVYATMFGCSVKKAQRVIAEIIDRRVADHVIEGDGRVTLINRRTFREWQGEDLKRSTDRERQRRKRGERDSTDSVTDVKASENGHETLVSRFGHGGVTKGAKNASSSSSEEISITPEDSQKKRGRKLVDSIRIPDPFPITAEMTEWAKVNVPTLRLADAHDRFVEYWTNSTDKKAWKVSWVLAWQKGMKLALKWQEEREARLLAGKYTGPEALTQYKCEECKDLGEVVVVHPDNSGYRKEPCRACRQEAIAA